MTPLVLSVHFLLGLLQQVVVSLPFLRGNGNSHFFSRLLQIVTLREFFLFFIFANAGLIMNKRVYTV